jgi:hypothetical protein
MAFIPPEIGFRVKNRFAYSEIRTLGVIVILDQPGNVKTS